MDSSSERIIDTGERNFEETIPDEILVEIFRRLPIKCRVKCSPTCRRWRRLIPYTDRAGCLHVTELPMKQIYQTKQQCNSNCIESTLSSILPLIGTSLQSLSFEYSDECEIISNHFDPIAKLVPQVKCIRMNRLRATVSYVNPKTTNSPIYVNLNKLSQLTQLTTFRLSGCFDNCICNEISSLISLWPLEKLEIVEVSNPPNIVAPGLTELKIWNCHFFGDTQLTEICKWSRSIAKLAMSGYGYLEDFGPIAQLNKLVRLELSSAEMTTAQLLQICQNCTEINHLKLAEFEVSELNWLPHLTKLTYLSIGNPGIGDSFVSQIPESWAIEELDLFSRNWEDDQLTNEGLISLSQKCPLLSRFSLSQAQNVTDIRLNDSWTNLNFLSLDNVDITGTSLAAFAERPNLRNLVVKNCEKITNIDGLWPLAYKRQTMKIPTFLTIQTDLHPSEHLCEELKKLKVQIFP